MYIKKFHIFNAVLESYLFAQKEWRFLLTLGIFPMFAQFVTTFFITQYIDELSQLESILWNIPATAISAWYMFIQTRLIMLDERLSHLSKDEIINNIDRRLSMRASIMTWILFYMSMGGIMSGLIWINNHVITEKTLATSMIIILFTVFLIWAIRFSITHNIVAINLPLKSFFHRVRGAWFSFYLIGMSILTILPISFVFGLISGDYINNMDNLTMIDRVSFSLMDSLSSFISITLLNGAACFAIKDILTPKGKTS